MEWVTLNTEWENEKKKWPNIFILLQRIARFIFFLSCLNRPGWILSRGFLRKWETTDKRDGVAAVGELSGRLSTFFFFFSPSLRRWIFGEVTVVYLGKDEKIRLNPNKGRENESEKTNSEVWLRTSFCATIANKKYVFLSLSLSFKVTPPPPPLHVFFFLV